MGIGQNSGVDMYERLIKTHKAVRDTEGNTTNLIVYDRRRVRVTPEIGMNTAIFIAYER